MVKSLSVKKRWEVVFLHCHRLGPKLPISKIAKNLKVSRGSINHWVDIYKQTGEVEELPKSGRKKVTGLKEDQLIKEVSLEHPEASAHQISKLLSSMNVRVSASTIRRRLKSMGYAIHPSDF